MKLARPFVRLPWQFDPEPLQRELRALDSAAWMPHPSGMVGNDALPLISRDAGANNDFDGAMAQTSHLTGSPYLTQVLATVDEVYGRSRLMRLAGGAEVSRHVDFNYHWHNRVRIHVPITTHPDVTFYCGDDAIHMAAGECWIFDSWRHHRVVNNSSHTRTHLVFDTAGSARFWRTVDDMIARRDSGNAAVEDAISHIAFDPVKKHPVKTERYNSAPVMAPGEMSALVDDLLADITRNQDNDPDIVYRYQRLLRDLVHDWRELWHLHGYQTAGWTRYHRLLESTVKQLDPNPRILTTASNQLGINPIIMQRIIRVALQTDDAKRFLSI